MKFLIDSLYYFVSFISYHIIEAGGFAVFNFCPRISKPKFVYSRVSGLYDLALYSYEYQQVL